jgi:hypothetical protein
LLAFIQPLYLPLATQHLIFWVSILLAAIVGLAIAVLVARAGLSSPERMILLALISVSLLPFLLPRMHERYFYAADIISTLYALYRPSRWYIPVIVVFASFISYFPFLSQVAPFTLFHGFDLRIPAVIMLIAFVLIFVDLMRMPEVASSMRQRLSFRQP